MTVFIDYSYSGGAPAPQTKKDMLPLLTPGHPIMVPPANPGPSAHDVSPVVIGATDLFWQMVFMGYGEQAQYALYWLVKSVPITAPQEEELKRLASARANTITRAYETVTTGTATLLVQREIYPLIESTEKGNISFYLGCAAAAVCGPKAIASRPGNAALGVGYLFHAKLLAAHATLAKTFVVNTLTGREVDFVAFDANSGIHIIEAKGGGNRFSFLQLAEGLDQCSDVVDITAGGVSILPESINASVAFFSKTSVGCSGVPIEDSVRCGVFALPSQAHRVRQTSIALLNQLDELIATQLLGLYLVLTSAGAPKQEGAWSIFTFADEAWMEKSFDVAVPTTLFAHAQDIFTALNLVAKTGALYYQLNAELAGQDRGDLSGELKRILMEYGTVARENETWSSGVPPQGFVRSTADRWIAIGIAPTAD